jgi:hypothetical protein
MVAGDLSAPSARPHGLFLVIIADPHDMRGILAGLFATTLRCPP